MSTTFAINTDIGTLTWSKADRTGHADQVAGGYLFGPEPLRYGFHRALLLEEVKVKWATYRFTEGKDTLADVAAAMWEACGERAVPNEAVVEALSDALPELTDPDNNDPEAIY